MIAVRLLRHDLEAPQSWKDFEDMRQRTYQGINERLEAVLQVARTGHVCDALEALYTFVAPDVLPQPITAHYACGGCAACNPDRPVPTPPLPIRPNRVARTPTPKLDELTEPSGACDRRQQRQPRLGARLRAPRSGRAPTRCPQPRVPPDGRARPEKSTARCATSSSARPSTPLY